MIADRQTHTQTDTQTDTLITILPLHCRGESKKNGKDGHTRTDK